MKAKDRHYLALQFKYRIYSKNGAEFQSFFEGIMGKAFPKFRKVRPQGKKGDAGNDGYERESGIYYQVYAPLTPKVSETSAADKLKEDFHKLKNGWNEISKINEYNFVFNDKYEGSVQLLEETITKLEKDNPDIKIKLFLANDLEKFFLDLDEDDILDLGFNIDFRQALDLAYRCLNIVRDELETEHASFALRTLNGLQNILSLLNDDGLTLEYEILECRCLQRLEKVTEARNRYENLAKRYPDDPRPLLYWAEIYLNDKDYDKNKELLEKAEKINNNFWLLKLEQLIRSLGLGEKIAIESIDEKTLPKDPREKAGLYRLYALISEVQGNSMMADSYIEKAIHLTPTRLLNYIDRLWLIELRMFAVEDAAQRIKLSQELLTKTEDVERKFTDVGDIGARNKANLYIKKLSAFEVQGETQQYEILAKETFDLAIECYFDKRIEHIIMLLLRVVRIPDDDLNKVLEHIRASKMPVSDDLSQVLVTQFSLKNSLFTTGKHFFEEIENRKYVDLINDIENNNSEKIFAFLQKNTVFAINLITSLKVFPELRLQIIEKLPENKNIPKDKLRFVVYFDEKDFDNAFEILKQLDLSDINYVEGRHFLHVAQQKDAWDLEIKILGKLLQQEINEKARFSLNTQLFTANINLKRYAEAINIGEQLLREEKRRNFLDLVNKEALLTNTIFACIERGKVDDEAYKKAKTIVEEYPLAHPTFEYKVGAETEVYLLNNEIDKARRSIVEGVKIKGTLSPTDYAKLYFVFSIKIGNRVHINQDSLEKVTDNTFVKLKNKDRWYFVGNDNPLDALPIFKSHKKYSSFVDKRVGETIGSGSKYRPSTGGDEIELIYSTEQYIFWQTIQLFHQLSREGDLVGVDMIEVPEKGDSIDTENLLRFLKDLNKRIEPIFELYRQNNIPLAVLAKGEGGLVSAIGHIQQEQKGFVNCSLGTAEEFEKQKAIAKKVIEGKLPFYIEGISAMFLSEIGMLSKIYAHIPNLKVPQSVINLLATITEKFRFEPGQTGYLGYAQGRLTFSTVEKDKRDMLRANFVSSIKLLESKSENISVISSANKIDCFSEREMLPELSDASILAQKENIPVLTDDFLYLQMNELETKKKAPEYFSSIALLRVLYEKNLITFENYLEYFGYLSSYRVRFLSIHADDIDKAVFGDGQIKVVRPENIRRLNFPLTLSEEYGVSFNDAARVAGVFLVNVLTDDAITEDIAEKIFIEILETYPTKEGKKELGQLLLGVGVRAIENIRSKALVQIDDKLLHKKIERLLRLTEIYSSKSKLWTPNQGL